MYVEDLISRENPGVDVGKLKVGTKLIVKTQNSTYVFITTKVTRELYAKGGKKILKAQKVFLTGSNYGGTCLKIGWIGLYMFMEIGLDENHTLHTSAVRSIRVIGPNKKWFYDIPS